MIKLSDIKKWAEKDSIIYEDYVNDREFDSFFRVETERFSILKMSKIIYWSWKNWIYYKGKTDEEYPLLKHALTVIETLGYEVDYEN